MKLTYPRGGAFISVLAHMRTKNTPKKDAPGKLLLYEMLYDVNRSFDQVLRELERLQQFGLFRGHRFLKSCQLAVKETRAWANIEILEILRDREESDWARFGSVRGAREKELGDPGDILIEAERLRQNLSKKKQMTERPKGRR
jgi:hypothetical protein